MEQSVGVSLPFARLIAHLLPNSPVTAKAAVGRKPPWPCNFFIRGSRDQLALRRDRRPLLLLLWTKGCKSASIASASGLAYIVPFQQLRPNYRKGSGYQA
jgi:hypothetical protein